MYQIKQEVSKSKEPQKIKKEESKKEELVVKNEEAIQNPSVESKIKKTEETKPKEQKPKEKYPIDRMIELYNEIIIKIGEKEKKGKNVSIIKLNTLTFLDEIDLLKYSKDDEEKENMMKKLQKINKLLNS